jgi:hypothetical protein
VRRHAQALRPSTGISHVAGGERRRDVPAGHRCVLATWLSAPPMCDAVSVLSPKLLLVCVLCSSPLMRSMLSDFVLLCVLCLASLSRALLLRCFSDVFFDVSSMVLRQGYKGLPWRSWTKDARKCLNKVVIESE